MGWSSSSTYTRGQGPFQRFTNSIVGVFLGILFIPGGFVVTWYFESRRDLAPLVRKKAVPTNPESPAAGFVKFTAKPEGAAVRTPNVNEDLVHYSEVEDVWRLVAKKAKEEEKIQRGDRTDTVTHNLDYTDYDWSQARSESKTTDPLAFGALRSGGGEIKWMGLRDLYTGPPAEFLAKLPEYERRETRWSSGRAAWRLRREVFFGGKKLAIEHDQGIGESAGIRAQNALFFGWKELSSRNAGSRTIEGKSRDVTEILEVVEGDAILAIGTPREGGFDAVVVSSLNYEDTLRAVRNLERPVAGARRVTVKGLPFGPPLFVCGDVSGPTIGRGPTELYIISGLSEEETIRKLAEEDAMRKWIGRIVGFLLLWIGMLMIGGPIVAFLELFPIVGGPMGRASGCMIGVVTFPVALGLIVLEVLFIQFWYVLLAGLLLAAIIGVARRKKRPA